MSTDGGAPTRELDWQPAARRPDLLAVPVRTALDGWRPADGVQAAPIDAELADTAEFCRTYGVSLGSSANCVVLSGRRDGQIRYAACMVLATTRADVNGVVRRLLDVRKCSFAPMAEAVELTGMEYGGITPIGLPGQWPILVAGQVAEAGDVVIGSGLRASKLRLPGASLLELPNAQLVEDLAQPIG